MANDTKGTVAALGPIAKCPTGITGLDSITGGGLPRGRPTLVCGSAGCGKTLMAMQFVVQGAIAYDEPGVFVTFEETTEDLAENVQSLGYDLPELVASKKLVLDYVRVAREEIEEAGDYDLDGLFVRLNHAIDSIGAKRIVLDTIETIFTGFTNTAILRSELKRLFRWLRDKGMTALITGERGDGSLTRHGLEEYVSDCVIVLDHRVSEFVSTRRLRVVKYRGTTHGTNEYPFLIDEHGIEVLPITAVGLDYPAPEDRISSGIPQLDEMLGGKGYYRGSSIMLSGTAGTGKTSVAASFAEAVCHRGERCLYLGLEESACQVIRNMSSIGIDLANWREAGNLRFHATRPTISGLESHLATIYKLILDFKPDVVVVDPINNFISVGGLGEVKTMLVRLIDMLKSRSITSFFTSLTGGGEALEQTDVGISSLIDTWLLVRDIETDGERNRALYVLKSRGMNHSNQVREFLLTSHGVELIDVQLSPEGVLIGSKRRSYQATIRDREEERQEVVERLRLDRERKRQALEAKIAALREEFEREIQDQDIHITQTEARATRLRDDQTSIGRWNGNTRPVATQSGDDPTGGDQ